MTVMVFIGLTSRPNVAENVRAWRIFGTKPGNNGDGPTTASGRSRANALKFGASVRPLSCERER
jgi:hypothetical protein